jgi:hypothetical protein
MNIHSLWQWIVLIILQEKNKGKSSINSHFNKVCTHWPVTWLGVFLCAHQYFFFFQKPPLNKLLHSCTSLKYYQFSISHFSQLVLSVPSLNYFPKELSLTTRNLFDLCVSRFWSFYCRFLVFFCRVTIKSVILYHSLNESPIVYPHFKKWFLQPPP